MRTVRPERAFLLIGLLLIATYGISRLDAVVSGNRDVVRLHGSAVPDSRLWSISRLRSWERSPQPADDALVGVLLIPSVSIAVPVYANTSELHLNRGVGLIAYTARPGTAGNVGIAGHRDGFFRALKDIRTAATIELLTPVTSYKYRVSSIEIVDRSDASLLQRTHVSVVTLVTCHPFYFVGSAPNRFVVRGVLVSARGRYT
jgi:sortase A